MIVRIGFSFAGWLVGTNANDLTAIVDNARLNGVLLASDVATAADAFAFHSPTSSFVNLGYTSNILDGKNISRQAIEKRTQARIIPPINDNHYH